MQLLNEIVYFIIFVVLAVTELYVIFASFSKLTLNELLSVSVDDMSSGFKLS